MTKSFFKYNKIAVIALCLSVAVSFHVSAAHAATLYFWSDGSDVSWTNVSNWYTDAGTTTAAGSLPGSGDDTVTVGTFFPEIDLDDGSWVQPASIDASATGIVVTSNVGNHFTGNLTGSTTFDGNVYNSVWVVGTTTFDDNSKNGAPITGNATFNNSSVNYTSVVGNAIFNDSSSNNGTVTGDATFNGESCNNYSVTGSAVFNGVSYNNDSVTNATFNDTSYNDGNVAGNATFNDESYNDFIVTGTSTFTYATGGTITIPDNGQWGSGSSGSIVGADNNPIDTWIFDGDSTNNGTIDAMSTTTFNDTSYNSGIINGNVAFYDDSSTNYGSTINGNVIFNDGSWHNGDITGDVIFNSASYNSGGTITGNATFNGESYNNGTIIGTSTLSYITGDTITIPAGGEWLGSYSGPIVNIDDNPIIMWVFDGNSANNGTVTGSAIFNDTSGNNGNIANNATFNGTSANNGTVVGTSTFPDATGGTITIPNGGSWGNGTSGSIVGIDNNPITAWIFDGNSGNGGNITGNVTFNDTSANSGNVIGSSTFNNTSINGGTIFGDAIFNGLSNNTYLINGNATFNDGSYNSQWGTVTGTSTFTYATGGVITIPDGSQWGGTSMGPTVGIDNNPITAWIFDGNSINYGTVTGNATFNDTSYNSVTVIGTSTFSYATGGTITIPNGGSWGNGTSGSIVGIDNNPITTWIFDGNSTNYGTVTGNVTFNDTSSNNGTITGSSTFVGDLSVDNTGSLVSPIREYVQNATTTRNFLDSDAPWTVIADGAIVNIYHATYDGSTVFQTENDGQFVTNPYTLITVPTIITETPTNISSSSVTFNSNVTNIGTSNISRYGFTYGTNSSLTTVIATTTINSTVSAPGALSQNISGLTPNTTYYVRAYARNSSGRGYGSILSFTTTNGQSVSVPTISTGSASSINQTSATIVGNISSTGGENTDQRGFDWGTASSYGATTTDTSTFTTGDFSAGISSLSCNTAYHFRAYAHNSAGYAYGSDSTFTTSACQSYSYGGGGGGSSSGSSVSASMLTSILAPSASTTEYLNSMTVPGCPTGFTCKLNPSASVVPTGDLSIGSTGSSVKALQSVLISLGYMDSDSNTGRFGPITQAALIKYQKDHGIVPASGYYGPLTRANMIAVVSIPAPAQTQLATSTVSFNRNLTLGSVGQDVKALQIYLNSHGFPVALIGQGSSGHETTFFGVSTQSALSSFQKARGIMPASGYFGPKTRGYIEGH